MQSSSFKRLVAGRYVLGSGRRGGSGGFLRFVTNVAIGGVALGVAALLIALAVVRGFSREIEQKVIGFGSHIQVESMRDAPLESATGAEHAITGLANVRAVTPVVQEFALLRRGRGEIDGVLVTGVPALPEFLAEHLVDGQTFPTASAPSSGIVVGATLARQLSLVTGDRVTAVSLRGQQGSAIGRTPRVRQFTVAGIFETSLADFDEVNVYVDISSARDLLSYGEQQVTRFDVAVDSISHVRKTASAVEEALGFPAQARTIFQVFRSLFAWVHLQQTIIPVPIAIIVIVASFNIVGALLMLILEKSRQIGIMLGMGCSRRQIRSLFLRLGLVIGTVGAGIGTGLALAFVVVQDRYGVIRLPAEAYYMDTAPVAFSGLDFLAVGLGAIVLSTLAAYVPARQAAEVDPVRIIRFR